MRYVSLTLICALAVLAGCSKNHKHDRSAAAPGAAGAAATPPAASAPAAKGHEHHAPHKGTLVEFGEEYAHLELVLDPATGTLQGYVLDGEAEKAVRVTQKEIEIKSNSVNTENIDPAKNLIITITLAAQSDPLTGEKEGDTSYFLGQSNALKNAKTFGGVLTLLNVKGKDFKDVKFNFPKGNE